MNSWGQEIYYYNTGKQFESEKFAGRFLGMLLDEMKKQKKQKVLFLCIGTDRSTGDSLGPLIGYKLAEQMRQHVKILGTLDHPVHAMNLEQVMWGIEKNYDDHIIVAVDASVGDAEHIGYVTLGRGSIKPGLGVRKELMEVGDLFITGIVGSSRNPDPMMLHSVRLSVVMRLADCISKSVLLGMNAIGTSVENFSLSPSPF